MTTRDTVTAMLAAYAQGDVDGALAQCADDVCFKNNATPNLGMWEFDCQGVDAFRQALGQINTEFELEHYEVLEILVDGNRAASRQAIRARHRESGAVTDSMIADFWTVEDGKVTSILEFQDTADIVALRSKSA